MANSDVISIEEFITTWSDKTKVLYLIGDNTVGIVNPKQTARRLFMEIPRLFSNSVIINESQNICPFTIMYAGDNYNEERPTIANVVQEFHRLFDLFEIKHQVVAIQIEQCAGSLRANNPQMHIDTVVSFKPDIDLETQEPIYAGVLNGKPVGVTKYVDDLSNGEPYVFAATGGLITAQEIKFFYKETIATVVCINSALMTPYSEEEVRKMLREIIAPWYNLEKINMQHLREWFSSSVFCDILQPNREKL